jgi:hypothetical protein
MGVDFFARPLGRICHLVSGFDDVATRIDFPSLGRIVRYHVRSRGSDLQVVCRACGRVHRAKGLATPVKRGMR